MSTSPTTFLSKPAVGQPVSPETFAYLRARAKRQAFDLVMKRFRTSGMTQAELGLRLGKKPDRVSRMLGGPGNWTIATLSDLLFAICGGVPVYGIDFPLDKPKRNHLPRDDAPPNPMPDGARPTNATPPPSPFDQFQTTAIS